jgi:hypothetical protein
MFESWYPPNTGTHSKLVPSLSELHWMEICDEESEKKCFFYVSSNNIKQTQWQKWDQNAAYVDSLWFVQ